MNSLVKSTIAATFTKVVFSPPVRMPPDSNKERATWTGEHSVTRLHSRL